MNTPLQAIKKQAAAKVVPKKTVVWPVVLAALQNTVLSVQAAALSLQAEAVVATVIMASSRLPCGVRGLGQ